MGGYFLNSYFAKAHFADEYFGTTSTEAGEPPVASNPNKNRHFRRRARMRRRG